MTERCNECGVRASINARSTISAPLVRGGEQRAYEGGRLICLRLLPNDFFNLFDRERIHALDGAVCTPDSVNANCPGCEPPVKG